MADSPLPRVLLTDDEVHLMDALVRSLRRAFTMVTAPGAVAALELLRREPPFEVIVADLRMPGMDGIALLRQSRELAPDTVRVLFTGNADIEDAVEAVNEGAVFRFVMKPCPLATLKSVIDAAAEQHRLITTEKVLIEQTLQGCINALSDVLALASPAAFGRGARALKLIREIFPICGVEIRWPVEMAARLSQIGCVTLPPAVLEKVYHGQPVSAAEQAMVSRLPSVTEQLLSHIPRIEEVRRILHYQSKHFDGVGDPPDRVHGASIPWGARALKVAFDFDALESQGVLSGSALEVMRGRAGWYDPEILNAAGKVYGRAPAGTRLAEVGLHEIVPGMVFAEDVKTARGVLLIARGQEVTVGLVERIANFPPGLGIREPVRVAIPEADKAAIPAGTAQDPMPAAAVSPQHLALESP
ncbi:MAG: response regulator [Acidobacteriota bacterium]|nr:response regulator [Acidobacteriota bacterium]